MMLNTPDSVRCWWCPTVCYVGGGGSCVMLVVDDVVLL